MWMVVVCRREAARVRRVLQGFLDVEFAQYSSSHSFGRKAACMSDVWQAFHCQLQSLLSPHDAQKGVVSAESINQ